jgi:proteasome accessory factor C
MSAGRINATDRMARLVAAIPWIVAQDGASLDAISERFDYPRDLLLDDLQDVVFYVGVPPYTPDTLIEVTIDDGLVWINYADWFSRPMKLSGGEALALLTAGETVLSFDRQDEAGALARGLTKLRLATGIEANTLEVNLGAAKDSVLQDLRDAVNNGTCVDIRYYSFAHDERTERRIEPFKFFPSEGHWYVAAYCHRAQGERVFRLDRIEQLVMTTEPVSHTADTLSETPFSIESAPRAVLRLASDRLRLLDNTPYDELTPVDDQLVEVRLPVSSTRWLERLLLRLGADAEVVHLDPELSHLDLAAARERVRARYAN